MDGQSVFFTSKSQRPSHERIVSLRRLSSLVTNRCWFLYAEKCNLIFIVTNSIRIRMIFEIVLTSCVSIEHFLRQQRRVRIVSTDFRELWIDQMMKRSQTNGRNNHSQGYTSFQFGSLSTANNLAQTSPGCWLVAQNNKPEEARASRMHGRYWLRNSNISPKVANYHD